MVRWQYRSSSDEETQQIAGELAARLAAGDNVLLYGELGAGKTAFTRGVVAHFSDSQQVTSPTFTFINEYRTIPVIYHVDLFRTATEQDLLDLGLEQLLDGDGIVIVEWAERCESLRPKRYYAVRLSIVSETEREIDIEAAGYANPGG